MLTNLRQSWMSNLFNLEWTEQRGSTILSFLAALIPMILKNQNVNNSTYGQDEVEGRNFLSSSFDGFTKFK